MMKIEPKITNEIESSQFIFNLDGKTGHLKYRISGQTLDLISTFVPVEFRGRQLGDRLVEHAIQFAKEKKFKIIPTCPFVRKYFSKHPELSELLA